MKLIVQHVETDVGAKAFGQRHTLGAIDVPSDGSVVRLDLVSVEGVRHGTIFLHANEESRLSILKRSTVHTLEPSE